MTTHPEYCPFVVGDRVVCVDAETRPTALMPEPLLTGLKYGSVYTVRWVGLFFHPISGEEVCIRLDEIHRPADRFLKIADMPFRASRFRPAPSISVFTELLNKAPTPADEVTA